MANYPITIGGRDIDLQEIGLTLQAEIKKEFPMNEVPESILQESKSLVCELSIAENNIMRLIDMVRACDGHCEFMR